MPEFVFTGTTPHTFPESRHSDGTPVRSVEPGEIRDFPEAPDHQWREATDEDRAAWAELLAARAAAAAVGEPAGIGQDAAKAAETPKASRAVRKAAPDTPDTAGTSGPATPEG